MSFSYIRLIFIVLLFLNSTLSTVVAQTNIGGVVNKYAHIDGIGTNYVVISDGTQFHQFSSGDTVLLIQMKGVEIVTSGGGYGNASNRQGSPGKTEFLLIDSLDEATNKVVFLRDIQTVFDVDGEVQMVRVPSYQSATVTNTLTADPWDSTTMTGGVLALFAGNKLTLNADIDVSGKGFKGAQSVLGTFLCMGTNNFVYPAEQDSSGYKGEGMSIQGGNPLYARGSGPDLTGGGGGNGGFSGGGGGSNYGSGGLGGKELSACSVQWWGGKGGYSIIDQSTEDYEFDGGLYLGGGGGGSRYSTGTGSSGGNGGGIVIIVCDSLIAGTSNTVSANGGSVETTVAGNAGAGGGGGGGSIAIYSRGFSESGITLSVKGGDGGDTENYTGMGGGGGGGYIALNGNFITPNDTIFSGGIRGTYKGDLDGSTAYDGNEGKLSTSFKPLLNGFLFNTIWSSVTGNEIDSICSNVVPKTILGTTPSGVGPFTIIWEMAPLDFSDTTVITGANALTYTHPNVISDTLWFRRIITDTGAPSTIVDESKWVLLIVQPAIENNVIGVDSLICYGRSTETPLKSLISDPTKGNGFYSYNWIQSGDRTTWEPITEPASTGISFIPPILYDTTYFKRVVTSGRCVDTSAYSTINVLAPISGNTSLLISGGSDTTICYGATPNIIVGSVEPTLSEGTDLIGDYAFQWLYSVDNVTYIDIETSATNANYTPGPLTQTTWFKRRALSTYCMDESVPVKVNVLTTLTNNLISEDQTVCYGTVPATITGSVPSGGDPSYVYWNWEQSTNGGATWSVAAGDPNSQNYNPPALTEETSYRRIVQSGITRCCVDTSDMVIISLWDLPTAAIVNSADTTICEGEEVELKLALTGASGWDVVLSENGTNFAIDNITNSSFVSNKLPVPTDGMTTFNYSIISVVDNNNCVATSMIGAKKAFVYRNPVADAGPDDAVCGPEYTLAAVPSDGTGRWIFPAVVLEGDASSYNATVAIDSSFTEASAVYQFIWEETNWQCVDQDVVNIEFFNRIDDISAGNDTAVMTFDNVLDLKATPLQPFETGEWSVESGLGTFTDPNSNITEVRNVAIGSNLYKWTVVNGECVDMALINVDIFDSTVPEGISPNGDGINDVLTIKGIDPENQTAELTIVTGAGNKVYQTSTNDGAGWKEWDGCNMSGEPLPEGTYHYILKIESKRTGVTVPMSGFIILKRR